MNKQELVNEISNKCELNKKDAEKALGAFIETVTETLTKGEKVQLQGFGTFEAKDVAERTGVIQMGEKKGETYTAPAHKRPSFKAGSVLKDAINA